MSWAIASVVAVVAFAAACGDPVPPVIAMQPATLTVQTGDPAAFTVTATGDGPFRYQWRRNGVAIAGATTERYVIPGTVRPDSGDVFSVIVGAAGGAEVTSEDATLVVRDVYVAGSAVGAAAYWVNGIRMPLELGSQTGVGLAVAAAGNEVYVAGWMGPPGENGAATLWRNGVASSLVSDRTFHSVATAVAVSGGDVYVAGVRVGDPHVAMVWKNGVATPLDGGAGQAWPSSLAVEDGHVYVAGWITDPIDDRERAAMWKDGVLTLLDDGVQQSSAAAIAVSGGDVYVAGVGAPGATLWKNGVAMPLSTGFDVRGVIVTGTDVYVAGNHIGGPAAPVLWKNGVATPLTDDLGGWSATAMAGAGGLVVVAGQLGCAPCGATIWKDGAAAVLPGSLYSYGAAVGPP